MYLKYTVQNNSEFRLKKKATHKDLFSYKYTQVTGEYGI